MDEDSIKPSRMTKILGIEFAPLFIPLERRMQTAAIIIWICDFLLGTLIGTAILVYLLTTEPFQPLGVAYIFWYLYDFNKHRRGGRRFKSARHFKLWHYVRDYFPITLTKTADLDPDRNYILGYHPHGILSAGAFVNFATEATAWSKNFPGIDPHLLILDGNFNFPIFRDHLMSGGMCSVNRDSAEYILSKKGKGNAVVIVVGGAAEALDCRPGMAKLTLLRRKGFVKIALLHGASLVPVFSFGENELFHQLENPQGSKTRAFQDWFTRHCGFAPPIFFGRGIFQYSFGFLPHRRKVNTVIGKPIDVQKNSDPTDEEIEKLHAKYICSLTDLYNEHKGRYGAPYTDMELVVV